MGLCSFTALFFSRVGQQDWVPLPSQLLLRLSSFSEQPQTHAPVLSFQELCLIRFHPATEEEEVAYISLYSYFSSRDRFGVVANNSRHVKDLYLIPLSAADPIPSKLLPFEGPGKHQPSDPKHPLPPTLSLP